MMKYTNSQQKAFIKFDNFINSQQHIFIINGYAGTGKTTLIRGFLDYLGKRNKVCTLLASTGRAAKILSRITKRSAVTIHSQIYKFDDLNENIGLVATKITNEGKDPGWLFPKFELCRNDDASNIFIIDESSMISDEEDKEPEIAIFGSGRLLSDLLAFAPNAKFIFVGDECQLPPVKGAFSPALDKNYFEKEFSLPALKSTLTEIVRQKETNDLLLATQEIRKLISQKNNQTWTKFPLKNYQNIRIIDNEDTFIKNYVNNIKSNKYNNATLICRSNKTVARMNSLIRNELGRTPNKIQKGELLLVTQNNLLSGLLNGDLVKVIDVGEKIKNAGLTFRRVEVEELNSNRRFSQYLIEEILFQNVPRLTKVQQRTLYIDYYHRMKRKNIFQSSKEFKEGLFKDDYLNALRAVFGYAITCHKAQGGEWNNVYLNIPKKLAHETKPEDFQWLYTALTRAKEYVYLIDGFWLK